MSRNMQENGPGTVVGVNVALSGTLKDQSDIAVYGMVDGEVISEKAVTVGESAQVKGPVKGQIVTVAGVVRGSIEATEKLEVVESGKVFGSINTKDLVVHSGAILVGKCSMPSSEQAEEEDGADQKSETDGTEEELKEEELEPELEEV